MPTRLRLMMGATALLYLGPLLAGLGGFGWRVVPVFVAIFLLWTLILRPSSWPQSRDEWLGAGAVVKVLAQFAVQILLVTVCFGIGRGLGGVLGALPPFPVMLPISISFLSIPLCRLIWDPKKAEAMDRFLDTAIAGINAAAAGMPPNRSDARALTARLLAPVQGLPDDTPDDEIERHLQAIDAHADPEDVRDVLLAGAQTGTASASGLRALILHATDPRNSDRLGGSSYPSRVFHLIAADAALALLYANRSAAQLQDDPQVWWDSVSPTNLREVASRAAAETADALHALADLTEALAPPDAQAEPDRSADAG